MKMKKKLILFLTCILVLMFSNVCLAKYSYSGKWILFGENNEYMIFCPKFLFDTVEDDPYEMGKYGVYFRAEPSQYMFLSAMDMDSMLAYNDDISTNTEQEIIKDLESKDFTWSKEEQYGISFIKAISSDEITEDLLSYIEDYYILDGERIGCWIRFFYCTDKEEFELVPNFAEEIFSTVQPVNGSREEIGQYKMYKMIHHGEDGDEEEDITDSIFVLTLAEGGEGYFWMNTKGFNIYGWDVSDGELKMSITNYPVEGSYQDGELMVEDDDDILYFRKSNDHLIYPYNEEE